MNPFNRIFITLVLSMLSVSAFSQESSPKKSKSEDVSSEGAGEGFRKVEDRSQRNWDIDVNIDNKALESNIERIVENAMRSVEVRMERLDIHLEPIEINLGDLDLEMDPIVINIPEINIDVEPFELDLDIDEDDSRWDNDEDDSEEGFERDRLDFRNGQDKDKEKNKMKDKSDKEEKDKSKGLKKIN